MRTGKILIKILIKDFFYSPTHQLTHFVQQPYCPTHLETKKKLISPRSPVLSWLFGALLMWYSAMNTIGGEDARACFDFLKYSSDH